MKVIKRGKKPKKSVWAKKFKCTGHGNGGDGCGATLLVKEDDLYLTDGCFYDGSGYETFTSFTCPCCGVQTDVDVSVIIIQSYEDWNLKNGKKGK